MKYIKLTNVNLHIIVDDEDFIRCKQYKWSLSGKQQVHAFTTKEQKIANFIMGSDLMYDHKDRNFLNNQKNNLRTCNQSQNIANVEKYTKNATSRFKGVHYCKRDKVWRSKIMVNQKTICLGTFRNESKAALAYNEAAIRYFGEFAVLNQIGVKS